ncbi:Hypothetical predicted protein, partial [Pelobates cultripes]
MGAELETKTGKMPFLTAPNLRMLFPEIQPITGAIQPPNHLKSTTGTSTASHIIPKANQTDMQTRGQLTSNVLLPGDLKPQPGNPGDQRDIGTMLQLQACPNIATAEDP